MKTTPTSNTDLDFYKNTTGKAAYDARMQGVLPILEIKDHPFYVDIRLMQVRPKDNFLSAGLDLNEGGQWNESKRQYTFYYDFKKMEEASIGRDITALPKNVVMIKFPGPYELDPVAMARMNGKDPQTYLKSYPMKLYHKAEVIALENTPLMDLVSKNKQQQAQGPRHRPPRQILPDDKKQSRKR